MKKLYTLFLTLVITYSSAQKILNSPVTTNITVTDKNQIVMRPGFNTTYSISFRAFIDSDENGISDIDEQHSPSSNENYIRSSECLKEDCSKKKETIIYYDGLGREKQALQVAASSTGKTIVTPYEYDGFGRQAKEFLPFPIASSNSKIFSISDGSSFYSTLTGDTTPYSEKTFEDSPLNRVLAQAAPGKSWKKGAGHEIEFSYETNTEYEVIRFDVTLDNSLVPKLIENGHYQRGTLYKTVTTDENKQPIHEFKDKDGKIILKRIDIPLIENNSSGYHDTYYVYDTYGNLTFVLPPKLIESKDYANNLPELGYQYQYDEKNRLVEKQLPGKGREFMVYDNQDRLVGTQNALMKTENKWFFTKYDKFGRIAITGIQWSTGSRTELQAYIKTLKENNVKRDPNGYKHDNITIYYTTEGYGANDHVLTVNYYDDYPATASALPTDKKIANGILLNGLPTHSITRKIDSRNFMYSTIFYDEKYIRPIETYTTNFLGGYTKTSTTLDFRGKTTNTVTTHKRTNSSEEIIVKETFDYYENELLKTHTHQVNNNPIEYLAQNSYNEINQLTTKKVGNNEHKPLQAINYKYNIRGWLTNINDIESKNSDNSLFAFKINYDKIDPYFEFRPAKYNGNISQTRWKSAKDNIIRNYVYEYDNLNRLTGSYYIKGNYLVNDVYNEYARYDKNGNIIKMWRTGSQELSNNLIWIDDLVYDYSKNSNKLVNVTDSKLEDGFYDGNKYSGQTIDDPKNDYTYDINGNLTKDLNKGISQIKYNYLNLPTEVLWSASKKINYNYDANGKKLRKIVTDGSTVITTDYINGFQYISKGKEHSNLQFFPTSEGYVNVTEGNKFNYVYNYTDHLGNVRLSYQKDDNGSLKILEENNYYPFGLKHSGYTATTSGNKNYTYKYNGKELQEEFNINLYDYGARNYDPAIGRWFNIDPLAEKYYNFSTYTYAANNPIFFIDSNGMNLDIYEMDDKGNLTNRGESERDVVYFSKNFEGEGKNRTLKT